MARKPQNRFRPKYGNRRTTSALIHRTFHSKAECEFAEHLWARQLNGEIRDLEFQKHVTLRDTALSLNMVVDFHYFDVRRGELVWCEYKGFETSVWKLQRRAWEKLGPGLYIIVRPARNRLEKWRFVEVRPAPTQRSVAGE